jgi:copper(I)-binding protein
MVKRVFLAAVAAAVVLAAAVGLVIVFGGPVLEVHDVSARLGTGSAAVYLTIHNHGLLGDCLVAVNIRHPEGLHADLHRSIMDASGVMRMERVEKICVGGLSEVRLSGLEGGGLHIMVVGDFHATEKLILELVFESGKTIQVEALAEGSDGAHNH